MQNYANAIDHQIKLEDAKTKATLAAFAAQEAAAKAIIENLKFEELNSRG
jgi:hypothetical protein